MRLLTRWRDEGVRAEIWAELVAYQRRAAAAPTAEEYKLIRHQQEAAAVQLYANNPDAVREVLKLAAASENYYTAVLGCRLGLVLGLAEADGWLNDAEKRLQCGQMSWDGAPPHLDETETDRQNAGLAVMHALRVWGHESSHS